MERFIDKAEAIRILRVECLAKYPTSFALGIGAAAKAIEDMPTADVEEVRHGRWVLVRPRRTGRNATYRCTVCKKLRSSYYNDVQEWEYCPCGAKMDGERREG